MAHARPSGSSSGLHDPTSSISMMGAVTSRIMTATLVQRTGLRYSLNFCSQVAAPKAPCSNHRQQLQFIVNDSDDLCTQFDHMLQHRLEVPSPRSAYVRIRGVSRPAGIGGCHGAVRPHQPAAAAAADASVITRRHHRLRQPYALSEVAPGSSGTAEDTRATAMLEELARGAAEKHVRLTAMAALRPLLAPVSRMLCFSTTKC
jgi:hypothetical protein